MFIYLGIQLQCSPPDSSSVNPEILLIQTGDYGSCWAHCIHNFYLKRILN